MQASSVIQPASGAGDTVDNKSATNNRNSGGTNDAAKAEQEMHDLEEEPIYEAVNGMVQPPFIPSDDKPHRNTNQLQFLNQKVFNAVYKHRYARPFRSPVNAIKLDLPDYHTIIKHPMDLGTIKKRLDNFWYYSAKECIRDFRTMFKNCVTYNKPGEDVVMMAQTLEDVFENVLSEMDPNEVEIPIPIKGGRGRSSAGKGRGGGRGGKRSIESSDHGTLASQESDLSSEQTSDQPSETPPPAKISKPEHDATQSPIEKEENSTSEPAKHSEQAEPTSKSAPEPESSKPPGDDNKTSSQPVEAPLQEPEQPSVPKLDNKAPIPPEQEANSTPQVDTPMKEANLISPVSQPDQNDPQQKSTEELVKDTDHATSQATEKSIKKVEAMSTPKSKDSTASVSTDKQEKPPLPSTEHSEKAKDPKPSSKPQNEAAPISSAKEQNSSSQPVENSGKEADPSPAPPPPPERKRRWGSSTGSTSGLLKEPIGISSNALKVLIPDLNKSHLQVSKATDESNQEAKEPCTFVSGDGTERSKLSTTQLIVTGKTHLEPAKDSPNEPSPARNPPSNIIFIKNLVRPFTLTQLKDLLNKTGKVVEEKFWIDKIKSKCYVSYENQEQAQATREALHGTRWPDANPKRLDVDFSTEEELNHHLNIDDKTRSSAGDTKNESLEESTKNIKNSEQQLSHEKYDAAIRRGRTDDGDKIQPKSDDRSETSDKRHSDKPPIREWDREKLEVKAKDGNRSPSPPPKRLRTSSPGSESKSRPSKDHSKDQDHRSSEDNREKEKNSVSKDKSLSVKETPVKLLEDLFNKTKTKPCIYWLPLDEQQAGKKSEERKGNPRRREPTRRPYWSAW